MKYVVIVTFADLKDSNYIYNKGDEYPRKGYSPSKERVDSLLTGNNLLHTPLIERIEEPKPVVQEVVQEQVPVVQEVVGAVVEEPKKRGRKKKDDA